MLRTLITVALSLTLSPAAWADAEARSLAAPATSPETGPRASDDEVAADAEARHQFSAPTHSFALDVGAAVARQGGWTSDQIFPEGPEAALRLHFDFAARGLDWRFRLNGMLPSYFAAAATVGFRREIGPWENPRFIARAGGGLEFMTYRRDIGPVLFVPVVVAEGETGLEVTVVRDRLTLEGVAELGLRFPFPLGFGGGFSLSGYVRSSVLF